MPPLSRELALSVLGLPNFATTSDIVIRYKQLAITCYPEANLNHNAATQAFKFYTIAAHSLLFPEKCCPVNLNLIDMYGFFQYIFFGTSEIEVEKSDDSEDDCASCTTGANGESTEDKAASTAQELIEEEEREKSKAEKKKAKKKKRKEKKKLEKINEKEVPEKTKVPEEKHEDPKSESEEDFDTSSAFVSVIAKKHKVPGFQSTNGNTAIIASNEIPKEDPQAIVLRSRQLALRGNEMASVEHYSEAIQLFSEAIKLDSSDFRFFGNRSYCYEMLHQYEKALKDAEKSLTKCPTWAKGHFRKGRALLGLKKYALSEQSFLEVLKYDQGCEYAIAELHHARVSQLIEKGYSKEKAGEAILKHGSVPEALKNLRNSKKDADIFMSDEENDSLWISSKTDSMVSKSVSTVSKSVSTISKSAPAVPKTISTVYPNIKKPPTPYDIKQDPNNPEGHKSLWVGNVQADVTEKKLLTMFSKFGEIISIKLDADKYYAFINYTSKSAPGKAMKALQGFELSGYNLSIRFPNQPGEAAPKTNVKKKGKR